MTAFLHPPSHGSCSRPLANCCTATVSELGMRKSHELIPTSRHKSKVTLAHSLNAYFPRIVCAATYIPCVVW